ncbi:MAG: glycosyltransferase [Candidatus Aminicenantes bacterium]|nr:glycosyltransferase [Candidatus Aminicenantes bacterium]NIM80530.1 glycosyltransferase [Candidatus Aminicenantes bacterium]NIN19886.1 glycosyltransferase [Candidatus Aminicenantes bacterium]NIN43762.1 glycosyltransferase [Candidatus Aminicenantes bacterium]NIN86512.1 glycosyltransferase [Candidatus Aminicenantes bacterium]
MNIPVLIPAYNPDESLWNVVDGLVRLNFSDIIIVNDGSKPECDPIFERLENMEQCHIVRHAVNSGKGRALKTGLNYFYLNFPGSAGVVTADADGQHQPTDILKVAEALTENPDKLILGVRKLGRKVPFRSLFGNVLTRFVFAVVIGAKISDTQSGLRGLPRALVPNFLKVKGERYEYEINMLILTKMKSIEIVEIPIETIYIEDNISSHFNPFFDSMKIYFQLLRFAFSSMIASFFDFIVFTLTFGLTANIMISLLIGRFIVGSMLNYIINKRLVFHSKSGVLSSLLKYYLALVVMSFISYLLINIAMAELGIKVIAAKIVVETLLFGFSFLIQREFVFGSSEE